MNTALHIIVWGLVAAFCILGYQAIKWLWFTPAIEAIIPGDTLAQSETETPETVMLIDSLEQINFNKLKNCLVDADYSGLIISGKPDNDQLYACWMSILSQYYQVLQSTEAFSYIKKVGKIEAINTKNIQVGALIEALRSEYEPRLTVLLSAWGYNKAFTPESLEQDLKSVETLLSNDKLNLKKMRLAYEAEQVKAKKNGKAATHEDYAKILRAIEKHREMRYNPKLGEELTGYDFALFYKELIDYQKYLKTINSKGHG